MTSTSGSLTAADAREIACLRAEVAKNPGDIGSLIRLGILLFEPAHETEQAMSVLRSVLARDEQNVDARFWLAKCFFHDYCDAKGAVELLEAALARDPARAECLSLLASAMADLDHPAREYMHHVREAVRLAPDWLNPRKQLIQALLSIDDLEGAERETREGLSALIEVATPSDPVSAYYETAVTGRAWPTARQELEERMKEIQARKTRTALYGTFPEPAKRS